jgi:hypothetical protein
MRCLLLCLLLYKTLHHSYLASCGGCSLLRQVHHFTVPSATIQGAFTAKSRDIQRPGSQRKAQEIQRLYEGEKVKKQGRMRDDGSYTPISFFLFSVLPAPSGSDRWPRNEAGISQGAGGLRHGKEGGR